MSADMTRLWTVFGGRCRNGGKTAWNLSTSGASPARSRRRGDRI